eukprot:4068-Heterococcus_DN1.PRE.2
MPGADVANNVAAHCRIVVTKRQAIVSFTVLALLAITTLYYSYLNKCNEAAAAVTAEHAAAVLPSHHKVWYTEAWEQLYESMQPLMSQLSLQKILLVAGGMIACYIIYCFTKTTSYLSIIQHVPTRAAISSKAHNIMGTMGIMIQSLCASTQRVVAIAKAVAAALAVLNVAYCMHEYYEQWSRAASVFFSNACNGSAEIGSKVMAALKQGMKSLQLTTGLTTVQVLPDNWCFSAVVLVVFVIIITAVYVAARCSRRPQADEAAAGVHNNDGHADHDAGGGGGGTDGPPGTPSGGNQGGAPLGEGAKGAAGEDLEQEVQQDAAVNATSDASSSSSDTAAAEASSDEEDEPAVPHAATPTPSNTTNAATGGKEDAAQAARRAEIEEKVALAKAAQEAKCLADYTHVPVCDQSSRLLSLPSSTAYTNTILYTVLYYTCMHTTDCTHTLQALAAAQTQAASQAAVQRSSTTSKSTRPATLVSNCATT